MKDLPAKSGPFLRRRWFEEHEFDDIAREALKRHGLISKVPGPVNIELFVDMEFGFSYEFRDLGEDCLGLMHFGETGPKGLFVHTKLDDPENPVVNRRCRSTLAHECGHGLLHTDLFVELWEQKKRTGGFEDSRRLITWRERNENVEGHFTKNSPDWWEYQADRMISALLLPVFPLRAALRGWGHEPESMAATRAWEDPALHALVRDTFEVSLAVARIRLERLYGGREV
jgi:hypothetical protein